MTLARLSFLASVFYKYRLRLQSRGSLSARWTQVPLCLAPVAAFKFPSLRHKRTHDHDHHHDPDSNSDETFTPHKSVLEPETETELGDLLELHPQADPTTAVSALRLPDESSLFTPAGGTGLGASSALVDVATEQTGEGMLAKQRQRLSALNARIEKARTRTENKILDGRTPEAVKAEAVRELRREEGNGGDGENGVSGHVSEGESVDKFERLFAPPSPLQKVEDAEKEREKGRVGGSGAEGAGESTETIGGGAKMTTKTADQRPPSVRHEPTAPHTSDTTRDHTAHPQHSHGSNEPLMTHQSHGTGVNHTGASHGTDVHDTGASHTHGAHEGTSTQTPAPSTTLKPTASDSRLTVGLSEEEQAADIGAGSGASVEGGGTGAATTASSKKDQKRLQEEIKELQKNEVVNRPSDTKEEEKGRRAGAALLRNRGDTVLARRVGRSDSHTDRNIERGKNFRIPLQKFWNLLQTSSFMPCRSYRPIHIYVHTYTHTLVPSPIK